MGVSSYVEFVTTLLSWILYENIFNVLADSGIVFIPFIGIILGHVISTRKAGDDEGAAAVQSVKRIETDVIVTLFVMMVAVIPVSTVSLGEMRYSKPQLSCKKDAALINGNDTKTTVDYTLDTIGGESGKAPVWWAIMHMLSKSVTSASIAGIPCSYELASVEVTMASTKIEDPAVRAELQRFIQDCFRPGYAQFVYDGANGVANADQSDVKWIGSEHLISNYYNRFYSKRAHPDFPFNETRDAGYEGSRNTGGHPYCNEWWTTGNVGMRAKLLSAFPRAVMDDYVYDNDNLISISANRNISQAEREDIFLRKYFQVHSGSTNRTGLPLGVSYAVSGSDIRGSAQATVGGVASAAVSSITEFFKDIFAGAAGAVGAAISAPGHISEGEAVRKSISFVQSFLLLMFVSLLPFLLVFSSYKISTIIMLTLIYFSFHFLSFIWALAYWLDNHLTTMVTQGRGLLGVFDAAQNPSQVLSLVWMQRFLYVVLPLAWTAMLGWIGANVNTMMGAGMSLGQSAAQPAAAGGQAVSNVVTTVATRGVTNAASKKA
jgi:hypothetical protein